MYLLSKNTHRDVRDTQQRGMTLVETMVAIGIAGLVMAGLMSFFLFSIRTSFIAEQRLKINDDIRQLTGLMTQNARNANRFFIYKSFTSADRDKSDDRLLNGLSGDCVIFVSYGAYDDAKKLHPVTKIVGYYRSPADPNDPASTGPVRYFERTSISGSDSYKAPEDLLSGFSTDKEVVQISRGLADGKLFYNHANRSVVVNGQIYHGNVAKRVTDTYNFTVSPRS